MADVINLKISQKRWRPICVNFNQGKIRYRQQHLQGRNELIAKAVGWKKDPILHVFDTTAGFGNESFLLAKLGCHVTLFERNPTIGALLQEGLQRGLADPQIAHIIERMTLLQTCAIAYLKENRFLEPPDVIYCDPMFEPRVKSALVKKEMQWLQGIVGHDEDAAELVGLALHVAKKRVVVKRPNYAPPLVAKPQLEFRGRSHRFDVTLISS
ncbi:MAG: class I SAM-dependent methyltransferase [Candidatus Berkiellales bacterium]